MHLPPPTSRTLFRSLSLSLSLCQSVSLSLSLLLSLLLAHVALPPFLLPATGWYFKSISRSKTRPPLGADTRLIPRTHSPSRKDQIDQFQDWDLPRQTRVSQGKSHVWNWSLWPLREGCWALLVLSSLLLSSLELSDTKSMSLTYEPYVGGPYGHLKINVQFTSLYRGTSLIRNSAPLETYGHLKSR